VNVHAHVRRSVWTLVAAGAGAVLWIARALEPDARGHGTHEQLGLPPCGFLELTGIPCPGCGLTTAFAHLARADVVAAFEANPGALPLFAVTLFAVPFAAAGAVTARRFEPVVVNRTTSRVAILVVAALVLGWVLRVCPG
jgi:hypothetical protein